MAASYKEDASRVAAAATSKREIVANLLVRESFIELLVCSIGGDSETSRREVLAICGGRLARRDGGIQNLMLNIFLSGCQITVSQLPHLAKTRV